MLMSAMGEVIPLLGCAILMMLCTSGRAAARLLCRVKCGVIVGAEGWPVGSQTRVDLVSNAWSELRFQKDIVDVDLHFVPVQMRTEISMDVLVEAYMEIGTTNISSLIGPYVEALATATEKFGLPYFLSGPYVSPRYQPANIISVLPKPLDVMLVAAEVARRYHWKDVALLYDSQEGMYFIERLVQHPSLHVQTWHLHTADPLRVRSALLDIRQLSLTNIILFASRSISIVVLEEAFKLSMLSRYYSWILPNMTLERPDLEKYVYTQMNFTTFQLLNNFVRGLPIPEPFPRDEYITIFDSLLTLYEAVKSNHRNRGHCHWVGEQHVLRGLTSVSGSGSTGPISFLNDGRRTGYVVGVFGLDGSHLHQIGYWDSGRLDVNTRLYINSSDIRVSEWSSYPLGTDVIRVVTYVDEPFVRLKPDNLEFEGLCVDLLDAIAEPLQFQFEIYTLHDQTGRGRTHEEWQLALAQELQNGNAALAIGPLTVTSQHQRFIDFTEPYFTDGISILMKKVQEDHFSILQPLRPLSNLVWLILPGVLFLVSLSMFLVEKSYTAHESKRRFTICDSVWFTIASFTLRAIDNNPRSVAGRILGVSLWFSSLLFLSSYTANLAAVLTVSRLRVPITSLEDLALQPQVKYGTVRGSQTSAFFQQGRVPQLQRMWRVLSTEPWGILNDSTEGFQLVEHSQGDYAFLWDSSRLRYNSFNNCRVTEVGEVFGLREYAFGVPKGVHYRDKLSQIILRLRESGRLHELESKWWRKRCLVGDQPNTDAGGILAALSIEDTAGVFVIIGAGLIFSLITALIERCRHHRRKRKSKKRQSHEETIASHPLCDGILTSGAQAVQEPFLLSDQYNCAPTENHTSGATTIKNNKQTNIF